MAQTNLDESYTYTVKELAYFWNVSDETIRRIFEEEDGVLDLQTPRQHKSKKRRYRNLRIPGRVALRVQNRMTVVVPQ
jgi:hypothetical protein